jgi:hypothetical protein
MLLRMKLLNVCVHAPHTLQLLLLWTGQPTSAGVVASKGTRGGVRYIAHQGRFERVVSQRIRVQDRSSHAGEHRALLLSASHCAGASVGLHELYSAGLQHTISTLTAAGCTLHARVHRFPRSTSCNSLRPVLTCERCTRRNKQSNSVYQWEDQSFG